MASEAPPFWYEKPGLQSSMLAPVAFIYGQIAKYKMARGPRVKVPVPVICVGNFTVGGTGKTPTCIALAKGAYQLGRKPGFLTRGYGGTATAPTLVDLSHHNSKYVGDEPLLLAKVAPTIVAKDRAAGADKLIDAGVDMIVMDDGFQSAHLHFDYSVLVVDAKRGLGNGKLIPSGPVRAPFKAQMSYAHALSVIGKGDAADDLIRITARSAKPLFNGFLKPVEPELFAGVKCLAFAAIGDPQRFYRSLAATGAVIQDQHAFPDHHYFTDDEVELLITKAKEKGLVPVTTRKDYVRLISGHSRSKQLADMTRVFDIELEYDDPQTPQIIIQEAHKNFRSLKVN